MSLTPPLGAAGIYKLKAPYSTLLRPNVSYRCDAIRHFTDIIEEGIDPFNEYYAPHELPRTAFERDMKAREQIVTLITDADHVVRVPTYYIESYPNRGGFAYQGLVLGVPLGPVPTSMDLSAVRKAVQDVVRDFLGITVSPDYVAVTEIQHLNQGDHNRLEAARAALIGDGVTDRQKALQYKALNDELIAQNKRLEEFIRNNIP